MKKIENLNNEIDEWRRNYANLETEKQKLYQEIVNESKKIAQNNETSARLAKNLKLENYTRLKGKVLKICTLK